MSKKPRPPATLEKHGKAFWNRIAAEYELLPQDSPRLEGACIALDRAHAARELLAKEGPIVLDRFKQQKPHPAAQIEATAWTTFRLLVRELGLDAAPPDSRPATSPRGYK